jgi:proteasome lid subunit RPN8/RPN11
MGGFATKRRDLPGLRHVCEGVVYPHVFDNADREVGGVLVGRTAADGGLPLITGAIEALSADERRATLTFTQDAWEHVHRTLDAEYPPDEQIVGWYHSHPGFGIFLSEHDLFIHRNFFDGRSQVALVVDPLAGTEGVFAWHGDDVAKWFERPTPQGWEGLGGAPVDGGGGSAHAAYPVVALIVAAILGIAGGFGAGRTLFGGSADPPAAATQRQSADGERAKGPSGQKKQGATTKRRGKRRDDQPVPSDPPVAGSPREDATAAPPTQTYVSPKEAPYASQVEQINPQP